MPSNPSSYVNAATLAEILCIFKPDGVNPPARDTTGDNSAITSVVFVSTGLWRITFTAPLPGTFLGATVALQLTTSADSNLQVGPFVAGPPSTLDIRNLTAGALANIATAADNRIVVVATFKVA